MNNLELQIHIEEDGIGYHIDNETFDVNLISDTILADMITEAKLLLDEIKLHMRDTIEELREENGDDCDCY